MEEKRTAESNTEQLPVHEEQNSSESTKTTKVNLAVEKEVQEEDYTLEENIEITFEKTLNGEESEFESEIDIASITGAITGNSECTISSDSDIEEDAVASKQEQTEEPELTLEQAQEICAYSFNNTLFLCQFPEIVEHLKINIAENIEANPNYSEVVKAFIGFLADQVNLDVKPREAAKPMTMQYKCGVVDNQATLTKVEPESVECSENKCSAPSARPAA